MVIPNRFNGYKLVYSNVPKAIVITALSVITLTNLSCGVDEAISDKTRPIRLVVDTPEVRRLIAEHTWKRKPNEKDKLDQGSFIDSMTNQASVEIPPDTSLRILQMSDATCTRDPHDNAPYIKVLVKSGSTKGQIGWGCLALGITRKNDMP